MSRVSAWRWREAGPAPRLSPPRARQRRPAGARGNEVRWGSRCHHKRNATVSLSQASNGRPMPATTFAPTESRGATDEPIAERVARLSTLAETSPIAAREEAWAWIAELGRRARRDRGDALAELGELFRAGTPATGHRRAHRGHPRHLHDAARLRHRDRRAHDRLAAVGRQALRRRRRASGDNLLLRSARLPVEAALAALRDARRGPRTSPRSTSRRGSSRSARSRTARSS